MNLDEQTKKEKKIKEWNRNERSVNDIHLVLWTKEHLLLIWLSFHCRILQSRCWWQLVFSAFVSSFKSTAFKRSSQRNKYSFFVVKHLWKKNLKTYTDVQHKRNTTQNEDYNMKTMNRVVWDEGNLKTRTLTIYRPKTLFQFIQEKRIERWTKKCQLSFPFTCKF